MRICRLLKVVHVGVKGYMGMHMVHGACSRAMYCTHMGDWGFGSLRVGIAVRGLGSRV